MVVGFIGIGLMCGSLSLDLQRMQYCKKILGVARSEETKREALELGLVNQFVEIEELSECDIIFLGTPVNSINPILNRLKEVNLKKSVTIIDLGSTKEKISRESPKEIREKLIPAHPMTGTEKFGPTAAIEYLYRNKIVVLCDLESSGEHQREVAIELFSKLGMKIIQMRADSHDRHAAFISHLPHTISYSLANTVLNQEDPKSILTLAAGGFRDMSRIAKSSPDMWEDIFKENKKFLIEAMNIYEAEFKKLKSLIEDEKWEDVNEYLNNATKLHNIL